MGRDVGGGVLSYRETKLDTATFCVVIPARTWMCLHCFTFYCWHPGNTARVVLTLRVWMFPIHTMLGFGRGFFFLWGEWVYSACIGDLRWVYSGRIVGVWWLYNECILCLFTSWPPNVPETCAMYPRDVSLHFHNPQHWEWRCRSELLSHPVTVIILTPGQPTQAVTL